MNTESKANLDFETASQPRTAELLRAVIEASPAAMVIVDQAGTMVLVNAQTECWFGYGRGELLGQPVEILVPERFREPHVAHRNRYFSEPRARPMGAGHELFGRRKDGSEFPVDISLHPIEVDGGLNVLAHIIDITERRRVELTLAHDRSARMHAILDTTVEAIITIDEQGVIEEVNRAVEKLFGYRSDELLGRNVSILMPPPYRDEHDGYLARYLATGQRKIIGIGRETVACRKDGSVFPIDISVSEVCLNDRRLFSGLIRDITARKQAEQSLRVSEDRYRSLVETAGSVIICLFPDHTIMEWNQEAERLFGYSRAEVLGTDYFRFLSAEYHEPAAAEIRRILHGRDTRDYENPVKCRDGTVRTLSWNATRLLDADGQPYCVVAIGQDITELKKAQQRLLQSERLAAIGQMMAGLAHESRNAIQRAQACQEMLAVDLDQQPELWELTQRTKVALTDLGRLYEEVRGYAAPIVLEPEDCDLSTLWRRTWSHLQMPTAGKRVTLLEEINGVELRCRVDRHRIEQVLRNILENAIAAVPEPGQIVVYCADAELDGTRALQIALRDNGPGLTAEQAARIFEPFFTTKQKGTGLGMAIAKRIVEAHGGRIAVGRSGGTGAEILVTLPRKPL